MKQWLGFMALLSMLGLGGCGANTTAETAANSAGAGTTTHVTTVLSTASGTFNRSLTHGGLTRSYGLYVPSGYDAAVSMPLLFNFHGYGGTSNGHMADADMRSLADASGFLLVYPQGSLLEGSSH